MGTTTKLTFEDYAKLPEREGAGYELDEGELVMEPSPALRHNLIRQRIAMRLMEFVESNQMGVVVEEMDFRLGPDTVRNPDVAFITTDHLSSIDLDCSPVEGAPALAVEVISPNNRAEDTVKKIHQYRGRYGQKDTSISRRGQPVGMGDLSHSAPRGSLFRNGSPIRTGTGNAERTGITPWVFPVSFLHF